jgi:threonine dehydratase
MSQISIKNIEAAAGAIDPEFLNMPQYQCENLSKLLGFDLVCKDESRNPVGCFKGRGADWWMKCQSAPVPYVCASAGNFGLALAWAGKQVGTEVHVFTAETANPVKVDAIKELGTTVHLAGQDFDAAKTHAVRFAIENEFCFVEDGREAEITEGAGTIGLELLHYPEPIDVVYVPLGNGALVNGIGCWYKNQQPRVKVIAVCAEGAPAMYHSWREGKLVSSETMNTIADGIGVRVPVPESLPTLAHAIDDVVLVNDQQIRDAMVAYFREENLLSEPAGAVSLAAAMTHRKLHIGQRVAVVMTGKNIDRSSAEFEMLMKIRKR